MFNGSWWGVHKGVNRQLLSWSFKGKVEVIPCRFIPKLIRAKHMSLLVFPFS